MSLVHVIQVVYLEGRIDIQTDDILYVKKEGFFYKKQKQKSKKAKKSKIKKVRWQVQEEAIPTKHKDVKI